MSSKVYHKGIIKIKFMRLFIIFFKVVILEVLIEKYGY